MVGKSVTVTCSFVYNLGYQQASRASYELRPANSQPTDQLESNGHQVYFDSIRFKFRRASVPVNRAIQKRSCKPDKWTSVYNRLWDIQPLSFSLIQHIHEPREVQSTHSKDRPIPVFVRSLLVFFHLDVCGSLCNHSVSH